MATSGPDPYAVPLDQSWFERHPVEVAFGLIGAWIVVDRDGQRVVARIVETEAYGGLEDGASHATMYRVGRETLRHGPGVLYMQFAYGMHTMTNIVSHAHGELGAILLRAADDPISGIDVVRGRRNDRECGLLVGPGNLSRGLGTHLSDTLKPLGEACGVWLFSGSGMVDVMASPRIGITRSVEAPWRFFDGNSRSVSKQRRGQQVVARDLPRLAAVLGPTIAG